MNDEELRQRYRRDFTNEPIKTRPEPASPAVPAPKSHSAPIPAPVRSPKQKSTKLKRWPLLILFVLVLAGLAGLGYWKIYVASPVPASIARSVDFPVLYPAKLPSGYKLQKGSFSTNHDIVQFKAANNDSSVISFTVQRKPSSVDFQSTFSQLANNSIFSVPLGQAATGSPDGMPFGIVSTDKSWLIVSSASRDLSAQDVKFILQNIKVSN